MMFYIDIVEQIQCRQDLRLNSLSGCVMCTM
jgi:hypothetical protein